ncbi:MAG: SemiSWEET family transporter [Candidatus Aenigmatarchaeota archaeon]
MVFNTLGWHHFHLRKRIHKKLEPYPSKNKWKRLLDKIIYIVAVFGPIMTIPQAYNVVVQRNTAGISAPTWGTYLVISIFWLTYGIAHKEKPIILANSCFIVLNTLIFFGTIL